MSRNQSAKERKYEGLATSLYDGNGEPRYREGIIAQLAKVLESTYDEGKREGTASGRESALRTMLSVARGLQQDAANRVRALEIELGDYMREAGIVKPI